MVRLSVFALVLITAPASVSGAPSADSASQADATVPEPEMDQILVIATRLRGCLSGSIMFSMRGRRSPTAWARSSQLSARLCRSARTSDRDRIAQDVLDHDAIEQNRIMIYYSLLSRDLLRKTGSHFFASRSNAASYPGTSSAVTGAAQTASIALRAGAADRRLRSSHWG